MKSSSQSQRQQLHLDIQNLLPELQTLQEAAQLIYQTGVAMELKMSDHGNACLRVVSDFDRMLSKIKQVLESTDEIITRPTHSHPT